MTLREINALRQRAAQFAGTWTAAEREIFDDQHERVALARDASAATYLADVHNVFLALANAWLQVRKALRDREAMSEILAKEKQ